jgi:hypothetical protein
MSLNLEVPSRRALSFTLGGKSSESLGVLKLPVINTVPQATVLYSAEQTHGAIMIEGQRRNPP